MPITVIKSNTDNLIHGTIDGKRTGCGIRYNYKDNIRKFTKGETIDDLIQAMQTLNCEKCRIVISNKMIKEDRKAENRREKEERKRIADAIKRGEIKVDKDGNPILEPQKEENTDIAQEEQVPVKPPVQVAPPKVLKPAPNQQILKSAPVQGNPTVVDFTTNATTSKPVILQAVNPSNDGVPQPLVVEEVPSLQVDDDIAQFMVNPKELKAQEEEPKPKKRPLDDINNILADLDALMSSMAVPSKSQSKPLEEEKPSTPVFETVEDIKVPTFETYNPQNYQVDDIQEPILEDLEDVQNYQVDDIQEPILEDLEDVQDYQTDDIQEPILEDLEDVQDYQIDDIQEPILEDLEDVQDYQIDDIQAPVLEDLEDVQDYQIDDIQAPVLEDLEDVQDYQIDDIQEPILEDLEDVQDYQIDDIQEPVLEDLEDVQDYQIDDIQEPILEDLEDVQDYQIDDIQEPIVDEIEEIPNYDDVEEIPNYEVEDIQTPILEDLENNFNELESESEEVDQSKLEELENIDFSKYENFNPIEEEEKGTEEVVQEENVESIQSQIPVQPIQNIQPQTQPVTSIPVQPTQSQIMQQPYIQQQYIQPNQIPQPMQMQPQFFYNAYGEAIPITYNAQNQPMFTVPVTYDLQGQPRPIPTVVQPTPMPQQPTYIASQPNTYIQPQQTYPQNSYTAPVQPQPTQQPSTPPPTRVVRNDAPPKISNPADKKPFDFSIFEKENTKPVFTASENRIFTDSIEEALSQLGIETESKEKNQAEDITPDFQEYVIPTKSKQKATQKSSTPKETPTLSETERKKREKIDAKFKKDLEKRGLDTSNRFKIK